MGIQAPLRTIHLTFSLLTHIVYTCAHWASVYFGYNVTSHQDLPLNHVRLHTAQLMVS